MACQPLFIAWVCAALLGHIHTCVCVCVCVHACVRACMRVCGCVCVHGSLIKMCSNLLAFGFSCTHRLFNHVCAMEHHFYNRLYNKSLYIIIPARIIMNARNNFSHAFHPLAPPHTHTHHSNILPLPASLPSLPQINSSYWYVWGGDPT